MVIPPVLSILEGVVSWYMRIDYLNLENVPLRTIYINKFGK